MTASSCAVVGAQGFLAAMDSEQPSLEPFAADLGSRWEIVETGITVKLYPSCAGTHPSLDALLDLQRGDGFGADEIEAIEIGVDPIVPTILLYDRPSSGLEGKFSMPFCAAAAMVHGRVGIDTFAAERLRDPAIAALQNRVTMRVDATLDATAPSLTQARVTVRLRDGRALTKSANGARGYPERPASDEERAVKFRSCATQTLSGPDAANALATLYAIESVADVRPDTRPCRFARCRRSQLAGLKACTTSDIVQTFRSASCGRTARGRASRS
jgi:2-methylcitrate dehydratase PrpD